jgi:hypothetical protein
MLDKGLLQNANPETHASFDLRASPRFADNIILSLSKDAR